MLYKATVTSYPVRHLSYNFATGAKLINTDCIFAMDLSGTDDAFIVYKMRPRFSKESVFKFIVSDTLAEVVAGSNVSANSNMLALPVFEDDDVSSTSVTYYFNVADVVWVEEDSAGTYSYAYVHEGAYIKRYIIDYDIDQIMDIATTGTTTTTTSTTSTTSTTTTHGA